MTFALSTLDIAIIIASLAAVVAVGLWAGRNPDKSACGYFLASGRLPWYIIGAAFVSTSVSSEQIVGSAITLAIELGAPASGIALHWLYLAAIAQAITMAGIVAVSLLTPVPAEGLWRPFHWTPAVLRQYDDGIRRPWRQSILLWWTVYIVVSVSLYWRFW